MLIQVDGSYGPCAVMFRGTAGVQSGYSVGTLRVQSGYSQGTAGVQSGYSGGTVRVQLGYSQGTMGVQQGYSQGTAGVQWGILGTSRGTVVLMVVVVVVDHISLGGPFMFSMNRLIIFCCAILLCNGL